MWRSTLALLAPERGLQPWRIPFTRRPKALMKIGSPTDLENRVRQSATAEEPKAVVDERIKQQNEKRWTKLVDMVIPSKLETAAERAEIGKSNLRYIYKNAKEDLHRPDADDYRPGGQRNGN